MKTKMILPALAFIAIVCSSCRKYEDGPGISLLPRKTRVENSWYVEKYLVNGVDSTTAYTQFWAGEFYDSDGSYHTTISRSTGVSMPAQVYGTWEFQNHHREIKRTLDNGKSDVIEITRLKYNSFWYRAKRGNDILEFHLTNDQRNVTD